MTLPAAASVRPGLVARIASARSLPAILRRAVGVSLHAEMLGVDDSRPNASNWRELSSLLRECEVELYPRPHMVPPVVGDIERALAFGRLADDAHNRSVMMRLRVERAALRSGKRVPQIIDAVCVEVAS